MNSLSNRSDKYLALASWGLLLATVLASNTLMMFSKEIYIPFGLSFLSLLCVLYASVAACLLPVAIFTSTIGVAGKYTVFVVLSAVTPAVVIRMWEIPSMSDFLGIAVFQVCWASVIFLIPAALVLFGARAIWHELRALSAE